MKRPNILTLTRLEDRAVPAGFGNAWIDTNLTASFVPDGTDVAGVESNLFATLGARMTAAEWQAAIRDAFQTWAAPGNLNVGFVSDDGRALGTPGPIQGSVYVGDIRISARPLSDNVLAISNPFDLISPWAGEIVINSNKVFDNDGSAGTYDLRTVLLQEVGHVLGVGNSSDPNSVMYGYYSGVRTGLTAGDVASITALYGVREADAFEGKKGNNTVGNATTVTYAQTAEQRGETYADLTTAADVDFYKVTLASNPADPTVVVRTGGLSQTRLTVTVYGDAKLNTVLGTATVPDADGNYFVSLTGANPNATVFIRVAAAADAGQFAIGGYAVSVGNEVALAAPPATINWINAPSGKVVAVGDGAGGSSANDTVQLATPLGSSRGGSDARWDYTGELSFNSAQDVDHYQFVPAKGAGSTLLVSVYTPAGGVAPDVAVLNADGVALPMTVLLRTATSMIVQVEGVQPNKSLVVRVRAADPTAWAGPQSYRLGIDLRQEPVTLDTLATVTLTQSQSQLMRTLEVTRSQMFRFQLSASSTADTVPTGARLTVFDSAGNVVFTMVAKNGQTVIGDALLAPGTYTVVVAGATEDGTSLTELQIDARYTTLTDPIGPALADDYTAPTTTSTTTTTTKSTTTATTDAGYFWLAPSTTDTKFLAPTDPYSSPWW